MSVNCVPPGRTSPYQNGEDASAKALSLKPVFRQAVVSGDDASFVPRRNRQLVLVVNRTAPSLIDAQSNAPKTVSRVNMLAVCQIALQIPSSNFGKGKSHRANSSELCWS